MKFARPAHLLSVLLAFVLCSAAQEVPKGPDGKPLPGAKDGKPIPPKSDRHFFDPKLDNPNGPKAWIEAVEKDMKEKKSEEGEVQIPNGPKLKWIRRGKHKWQIQLNDFVFTVDDENKTKAFYPPPPPSLRTRDKKSFIYMSVVFFANSGCADAIWVQYKQYNDTFYDGNTKVDEHQPSPDIDGGIPYPNQKQSTNGSPEMADQPGLQASNAAASDRQVADQEITQLTKDEAPGKTVTRVVRVVKFWTYLICVQPYSLIGHYEWGFTVTYDKNGNEPIKIDDRKFPVWASAP